MKREGLIFLLRLLLIFLLFLGVHRLWEHIGLPRAFPVWSAGASAARLRDSACHAHANRSSVASISRPKTGTPAAYVVGVFSRAYHAAFPRAGGIRTWVADVFQSDERRPTKCKAQ